MLVDLLHLSRNLRRSPASAVAAIVTLSLTVGTAVAAAVLAIAGACAILPAGAARTNPMLALRAE